MATHLNTVYLLTGSNLGDRKAYLQQAQNLIEQNIGPIKKTSRLHETQAWGNTEQPNFINQALEVATVQHPHEVLKNIAKIEADIGRIRAKRWGERVIDIDILLYNETIVNDPDLIIPHLHLHERNFALIPLMEVASDVLHPVLNIPIKEVYRLCNDSLEVLSSDQ